MLTLPPVRPTAVAVATAILISACGGGGGDGPTNAASGAISTAAVQTYSLVVPTKIPTMPLLGAPDYTATAPDYGIATASFAGSSNTDIYGVGKKYDAATASFPAYSTLHLDAAVRDSWQQGWNGNRVTISIIDDFTTRLPTFTKYTSAVTRTGEYENGSYYGKVKATHSIQYSFQFYYTHGEIVSAIAGGDVRTETWPSVELDSRAVKDTLTDCIILRAGSSNRTSDCPSRYHEYVPSTAPLTMNVTANTSAGVARKALVIENNVNLSASQNTIQTVAYIQGHIQNSSNAGVINLSLGKEITPSNKKFEDFMAEVSKNPLRSIDAVITISAGNGGGPCANGDSSKTQATGILHGCNEIAVALAHLPATGGSTIVVGALEGVGKNEIMAPYSTRAGVLAQRYVLASGAAGDGDFKGTSFAAPRVAGIAAILKQKYPSLTAHQIANVILLSASKDMNNDGYDDFTGVHPVYGHGKASLPRALALAGAL